MCGDRARKLRARFSPRFQQFFPRRGTNKEKLSHFRIRHIKKKQKHFDLFFPHSIFRLRVKTTKQGIKQKNGHITENRMSKMAVKLRSNNKDKGKEVKFSLTSRHILLF